ncbi:phage major capsid protein [Clostridium cochlearium]|uniref:phage major capsid protein n=1 Tax=Clostridium cochlearium TaxID=1494 RepID=UPI00241FDE3E|nr:phage major capsid protein [Clostridium cochlearium]MBE6064696.1 phage major capsid protein [Clostridium cochlearium]
MEDVILSQQLDGLIPEDISKEIINNIMQGSIAMKYGNVEPMKTPTKTIPVVIDVPGATWVGEGEKIKVGKPSILPVNLKAKKIGIILTASREVLNDSVVNVFQDLKDAIAESFYSTIDRTIFTGDEKNPFPKTIYDVAVKNGITATDKLNIDISDTMGKVEEKGYSPTTVISAPAVKTQLRNLTTSTGEQLIKDVNSLYNVPAEYTTHFDNTKTPLMVGDFNYLRMGILQDISYDVLRESNLELENGTQISLGQQDLLGLRITMRVASLILKDDAFSLIKPGA